MSPNSQTAHIKLSKIFQPHQYCVGTEMETRVYENARGRCRSGWLRKQPPPLASRELSAARAHSLTTGTTRVWLLAPLFVIATYAFCQTLTGGRKRANHESSGTTCIQAAKRVCVDAVYRHYSLRQMRARARRRGRARSLCDLVPGLFYARQPAQSRLGSPPSFLFRDLSQKQT